MSIMFLSILYLIVGRVEMSESVLAAGVGGEEWGHVVDDGVDDDPAVIRATVPRDLIPAQLHTCATDRCRAAHRAA